MAAYYLVDVGQVIPVLAKDPKDAAYLALLAYPRPAGGKLVVQERDSEDSDAQVTTFVVAERKCRKCGCAEQRACKPAVGLMPCSWVAWDLCSACQVQ